MSVNLEALLIKAGAGQESWNKHSFVVRDRPTKEPRAEGVLSRVPEKPTENVKVVFQRQRA